MEKKLILPVEIKSRELDATIVLAIEAIKRGWTVYLGQKQQIWPMIELMQGSVYFLKSIVPGEYDNLKKIKKNHNFITCLDIEGLNMGVEPIGATRRYSDQTIKIADKIFFWGLNDFLRVKKKFKNVTKKSFISGSPVVDSWKVQLKKLSKLKKDNSILISMNFMRGDPSIKYVKYDLEKKMMGPKINKKQIDYLKREYELKDLSFKDFYEITGYLAKKFPKRKIVVRPHPEENIDRYKPLEARFNNLIVDNQTSRVEQLKKCSAFIHFNSTMSVQAYFMKKNSIMYNPIKNKRALSILCPVPKLVSEEAKNKKKLISSIINPKEKKIKIGKLLQNHKSNASKKIILNLEKFYKNKKNNFNNSLNIFSVAFFLYKYKLKQYLFFVFGILSIVVPNFKKKYWRGKYFFRFINSKWSNLSKKELIDLLRYYNCKKIHKLKIKKHLSGMYEIKYD
jgi:surface carbohydrate biosynthesis protein